MAVATSLAMLSACDDGTLSFDLIKPWWFQFVLKEHLCSKVLPAYLNLPYFEVNSWCIFRFTFVTLLTYEYETKVFQYSGFQPTAHT